MVVVGTTKVIVQLVSLDRLKILGSKMYVIPCSQRDLQYYRYIFQNYMNTYTYIVHCTINNPYINKAYHTNPNLKCHHMELLPKSSKQRTTIHVHVHLNGFYSSTSKAGMLLKDLIIRSRTPQLRNTGLMREMFPAL